MKKLTIFLTQILACGLLAAPSSAQFIPQATAIPGSAPEGINYQGRLEDGGFPVNATKSMIFRVYTAPVGGVLLWTSPTQAVPVALGLFSAVVPVPTTVLVGGGARYLEVSIDGTLMSPRELLNSVPYALIAKSVEGNIDVSTAGLSINANSTAPQPALYISSVTGNVGVGTGAPLTAFDVGGSAAFGSAATKSTFSATGELNTSGKVTAPDYTATYGISASTIVVIYVQSSSITTTGNVNVQGSLGVGTPNPGTKLHLSSGVLTIDGNATNAMTTVGRVGIGTALPTSKLHMSSGTLTIDGNTANSLTTTGSVGIGTPTPDHTLHVAGTAKVTGVLDLAGGIAMAGNLFTYGSNGNGASDAILYSSASNVGVTQRWILDNQDNTNAVSNASLMLQSGGAAGGDPFIQFNNRVQNWTMGMDNSDSDKFKLSYNTTLGSNDFFTMDGVGNFGIGNTAPATTLDVTGSSQFGTTGKSTFTTTGALTMGGNITFSPDNTWSIGGGPATTRPSVVYSGYMLTGDGAVATPAYRFSGGNAGIFRPNGLAVTNGVAAGAHFSITSGLSVGNISTVIGAETATLQVISTSTTAGHNVMRLDNNAGAALFVAQQNGRVGIGTNSPNDTLDVAGGNVRLTAVAGSLGSVKLFSTLTVGAVTCTAQCGGNTTCLAAWDSAGVVSTCGTAAAANRCLCAGFGN